MTIQEKGAPGDQPALRRKNRENYKSAAEAALYFRSRAFAQATNYGIT
jgi:hypothetical protein